MSDKLPISIKLPDDFFAKETRNDYVITSDMKKVWAIELDLLAEFDRICKKYHIEYMACGGTILGAVRHKGYIPWDDDIDLMMKRSEYIKLCSIADEEFIHPYFFQTEYTDPGSLRGHAQLRNSLTTGILKEEHERGYSFNQGIFIDIFPMDNIPDNEAEKQDFFKQIKQARRKLVEISNFAFRYNSITRKNSRLYKRFVKDAICPIIRKTKIEQRSFRRYEEIITRYNSQKTTQIGIVCVPALGERFHYQKKDIEKTIVMAFENQLIPIPINYEAVLTKQYGNWRKMIKAPSVHGGVIFDPEIPYKEFRN